MLGPLEVLDRGQDLPLGSGRQRALLALLLVHANEALAVDRIVDELWGESPPATAAKIVQIYVSQLRKALGEGRIVSQRPGYLLRLEPGELDVDRVEILRAQAREAEPEQASALLRKAIGVWRGHPLSDVAYDDFVQPEVARLKELHLALLEERIDADLAVGRQADLVPELELLVARYPLQERLRADQMLALYRCGRQADALAAYQDVRRTLDEQLGIQPGERLRSLEQAILNHDEALAAPPGPERRQTAVARRRGPWFVVAGAVVLLAAGIAAAVLELTHGGGSVGLASVMPDSLAAVDPSTQQIVGQVPVIGRPSQVAVSGGLVWVYDFESRTLSGIDPLKLTIRHQLAPGSYVDELEDAGSGLWLLDAGGRRLLEVDPFYASVAMRVPLPAVPAGERVAPTRFATGGAAPAVNVALAIGDQRLWLTDGATGLLELDAASGRTIRRLDLHVPLNAVAAGAGAVWALSGPRAAVFEVDPRTGRETARIPLESRRGVAAPFPFALAVGEGAVWVLGGSPASVTRIDPKLGSVTATIPLGIGADPVAIATGSGAVWVADSGTATLARIDASTNALTGIHIGGAPVGVAVGGGRVFVSVQPSLTVGNVAPAATLSAPQAAALGALPSSFCSPVYYDGRRQPRYLIAADLPLQGYGGLEQTLQMSDAIRLALAEGRFRAGSYSVGYQLCDDSSAQLGSWSPATCRMNAKAFVATPRLLGVIGPLNSGCAEIELPIIESAAGGPLAMISPSATYVGLTHRGVATLPGEPGRYYPRGVRNFVRTVAADDAQGAADAFVAKRLGVRALYLLTDGEPYGIGLAGAVDAAARKLGITVAGSSTWEAKPATFPALIRRIKRSGADGVFLSGYVEQDGPQLIRALRRALGPHEKIVTPDGFTPIEALLNAGAAAEGVTISVPGTDPTRLPAAGRRFADRFAAAAGNPTLPYSAGAAQAAQSLLAAIARSNGSRASVNTELRTTPTVDGILGSFHFDPNGDTTLGTVTIYRIQNGKAVIWQVVQPRRSSPRH